jgi:hypothetical protein
MKPKTIALDHLDATIRAALKNFSGGALPGIKQPIVNGIVIDKAELLGQNAAQLAADITAKIKTPAGMRLTPNAMPLGKSKILVGFTIDRAAP